MIDRQEPSRGALLLRAAVAACALAASAVVGATTAAVAAPPARQWLDLPYAQLSAAQKLDLYVPATGKGPFPVVVWVHGGAWRSGDKQLPPNAIQFRLLERGYALASLDYRLSGEATFPAQIHDVKAAIRWLRANAKGYRLDPKRVGAWGSSAGGHLVALLGTSGGVAALEGAKLGNAKVSSRVQAVVDWFGPVSFLEMDTHASANGCPRLGDGHAGPNSPESLLLGAPVKQRPDLVRTADPITYVSRDDPPFLIEHGGADCIVPFQQSVLLRDALLPVVGSKRVWFTLLRGVGHGGRGFVETKNVALVFDFLDRYLRRSG